MASSVTEAQGHDEGSGGRSVTGVLGSVTGKQQKCNWGHGYATSRQRSVTGAMITLLPH